MQRRKYAEQLREAFEASLEEYLYTDSEDEDRVSELSQVMVVKKNDQKKLRKLLEQHKR